jgi:non-homologous end joining protein Ku
MMTEYNIVMVRSPGLTEDEIERRLREAYDVLFAFADRRAAEKKDAPTEEDVKDTLDALQVGATQAEQGTEAECTGSAR